MSYLRSAKGKNLKISDLNIEKTQNSNNIIVNQNQTKESSKIENTCLNLKYTCKACDKLFSSFSTYEKHKKNYSGDHKYYKCCKKIEKADAMHKCKKPPAKKKKLNMEVNKNKMNKIDLDSDNGDSNEENQEIKGQKSAHLKKEKIEEVLNKFYKCQECVMLFDKHSSLVSHMKEVHKRFGNYKCQICEEEFETENDFKAHVSMHGEEDKVICKGCKKIFDSLRLYYIHAKQNPGVHCFVCKLCLRLFPTELMLEQHVCICQNGKPLNCACGEEFTKYEDVIKHSKGTRPFKCCSCPHFSISLTAYLRHLRKHSKQKPYQCSKCDMKFAVIDFLNIHNKKCHSESELLIEQKTEVGKQISCNICNKVFSTSEELSQHERQHERVQCPDCGKLLKPDRLENHRYTHKTSASLCPSCGKLFETRFKLTQHIITTHSSEPVKCKICDKILKTKKILNEHMKTHITSEFGARVPQAICPMCGLGLAQKGSLARHILLIHEKHKIVSSDKSFTCQECSAVLPNRAKYYSHRRMHRAEIERFPCEICGREFNKKQNLKRHVYLLHDEKRVISDPVFKCQICTRCFREKKNLKRHYKMVHKLQDVE